MLLLSGKTMPRANHPHAKAAAPGPTPAPAEGDQGRPGSGPGKGRGPGDVRGSQRGKAGIGAGKRPGCRSRWPGVSPEWEAGVRAGKGGDRPRRLLTR